MDFKAFIDSYPFKSIYKVWPEIKERYPNVKKKDVIEYLNTRAKDYVPKDNNKYQRKTYTNYIGGWQMDLLVSSKNQNTNKWRDGLNITGNRYYLLCININTRFIYASNAIVRKDVNTVLPEIKKFVETYKPLVIICDNEGAFTSQITVEYLVDHDVELKVITEQLHSSLGIINRACRTLRDMIGSNDIKNDKLHDVEELYIINCILKDIGVIAETDYDLDVGTKVRYILDKKAYTKVRHKISKGYYTIDSIEGNNYVIIAKDGTTKKIPRYRLIPLKDNESNIPQAETIEEYNANRGVIEEILDYNVKTKKYRVRFTVPNGQPYIDTIPATFMRESSPTSLSKLEREFFNKNKSKYKVDKLKITAIK